MSMAQFFGEEYAGGGFRTSFEAEQKNGVYLNKNYEI